MHQKIHKLIKISNIKQRHIAEKMGIATAHLQMYLLGHRRITLSMMQKMTQAICDLCDENIGKSMVLKNELQKLLMDMSDSDSIRDV
jgi:transcriptional regulator with XRE-family HTH domain